MSRAGEPDEPRDELADRLGQALTGTAQDFEPRPDAYARLAARVTAQDRGRFPGLSRWRPSSRLGLVAASGVLAGTMLILAVGLLRADQGVDSVALGGGAVNRFDSIPSTTGVTAPAATEAATTSEPDDPDPSTPSPESLGPGAEDPIEAADRFLDLLAPGISSTRYELAPVTTPGGDETVELHILESGALEPGEVAAVLELAPVSLDGGADGWAVARVTSEHLVIAAVAIDGRPVAGSVAAGDPVAGAAAEEPRSGSALTVSGEAVVGSGNVEIELRSGLLGTVLDAEVVAVGATGQGAAAYEGSLTLTGTEHAWLVVRSDSGPSVAFAAEPMTYAGQPDLATWVVSRIKPSDPDKGLRLRTGPSTDDQPLRTLAAGSELTRQAGVMGVRDGDTVWWLVEAEGDVGWVSTRYLARLDPGADRSRLVATTQGLLLAAAAADDVVSSLPLSRPFDVGIFYDGVLSQAPPPALLTSEGWRKPIVASGDGTPAVSLIDALGLGAGTVGGLGYEALLLTPGSDDFVDEVMRTEASEGYFAGLPYVTARYDGSDGRGRVVHFFYEDQPTGPALVGLIIETTT